MSGTTLSIGQFAELSAAVLKALPRDIAPNDALLWARNGEKLQEVLRSTLAPINVPLPSKFGVYLECEVGGKSKDELLAELTSAGMSVSDWTKDIMSKPTWKPGEKETVKFARARVRDLGFAKNPTTAQIWARIRELGHSLCEPQDGPAIRLALKDQPHGDYFWVAMEQITHSDGRPRVFRVKRDDDGKLWLDTPWVYPGYEWNLDDEVVFRLRNSDAPTL